MSNPTEFHTSASGVSFWQSWWHPPMQTVIDYIKKIESRALTDFISRKISTHVGTVRILEAGVPKATHPSWIFLHGFAGQAIDWAPLLRLLRPYGQHLVAIDLPGHGQSPPLQDKPENEKAWIHSVAEAIALITPKGHPLVLFGNSLGGFFSVRLAQQYLADRTAGLVLMSPFGAPLHPNDIARIQKKFRIQNYAEAKQFMSRIHAADSYLTPAIALAALSHFNRPHLREMVDSLPQLQLLSAYELTNTPKSLLIWGNADVILPVYARDFFVRFMPLYATHQDDIFGHIPHLDAPSLLARYILNYLHQL